MSQLPDQINQCYTVKIVNPTKKSEYVVEKLDFVGRFQSVKDLESKLEACLDFKIEEVWYIIPGHWLKGRLQRIVDESDLMEMYGLFGKRKDIVLWCYKPVGQDCVSRKRVYYIMISHH